jgi:hypothetical protein
MRLGYPARKTGNKVEVSVITQASDKPMPVVGLDAHLTLDSQLDDKSEQK